MKGKILQLESLRGIAALMVTIYHANFINDLFLTENNFSRHGYLMVDLFFVLSGFVIAYSYVHRLSDFKSLLSFQKRRFFRLYPLHLLTLLVFAGVEVVKKFRSSEWSSLSASYEFLQNLLLTQSIFLNHETYNHVSWSISTEYYSYLIYGLVVLAFNRRPFFKYLIGGTAVVLGIFLYTQNAGQATTGFAIFRCLYSFLLGSSIWHFCQNRTRPVADWLVWLSLLGSLGAVCFGGVIPDQLYPPFFVVLVYSLVWMPEGRLKRAMESPQLVYLGTLSYSVYMWHYFIWWLMRNISFRLPFMEVFTNQYGKKFLVLSQFVGSLYIALGLGLILLVSHLSYHFVEKRFIRKKKELSRREIKIIARGA